MFKKIFDWFASWRRVASARRTGRQIAQIILESRKGQENNCCWDGECATCNPEEHYW